MYNYTFIIRKLLTELHGVNYLEINVTYINYMAVTYME